MALTFDLEVGPLRIVLQDTEKKGNPKLLVAVRPRTR